MHLPATIFWPMGAVLTTGIAFGLSYFWAVWEKDLRSIFWNQMATWTLMALYASIAALAYGAWWVLKP